jgi:2-dehydro-3-deoxygluconokinase
MDEFRQLGRDRGICKGIYQGGGKGEMKFDMTTFGETMIRISVRPGRGLENATEADIHTGGTESNTAVALSRLGKKTAWISRLPENPPGRRIEGDIKRHGVDTSRVIWTEKDRAGTYYVEFALPPRSATVTYDRRYSAMSRLKPKEIDWKFLLNTRIIHLTGITAALSESCRKAVAEAIKKAKARRVPYSFDLNYRSKLWNPADAAKTLSPMLKGSALAIMTKEDAALVFKLKGEPEKVVRNIKDQFRPKVAVLTMGGEGALAWDGKRMMHEPGLPLQEVVDRLGAGDAFSAGLIYGFLEKDIALGLKYGMAMSAMKMGMRGDYFWADREEVEQVIKTRSSDVRR